MDDKTRLERRTLFAPCETTDALSRWIRVFLGFDLPDTLIDPESTSTPMDLVWEIYNEARQKEPKFDTILGYACREGIKTLAAAILEVLALFHLGRSNAHLAAIEQQAQKCAAYVRDFLARPHLRDFKTGDNKREIEVVWYARKDDPDYISEKEWKSLPVDEQEAYSKHRWYMKILVATMQSCNSDHVPYLTLDELDLAPAKPVEEAKMIPSPMNDRLPITFYTSTRKFAFGLVQKEIDNAEKSGLQIRHWNIIDVTERCPAERHRPDKPKVPLYFDDNTLRTLSEKEYHELPADRQESFVRDEGYAGCYENCKLFAMCRGRLATQQRPRRKLGDSVCLLKPIAHVINQFKKVSLEAALAQLLCRKPAETGLIYSRLDEGIHKLTVAEIATLVTGDEYPDDFTKSDLIQLFRDRGARFVGGMDFGYSHNFAVCIAAVDGNRAFVIEGFMIPGLELAQKLEHCDSRIAHYNAEIYPDTASPADIKTFKRHGYTMKDWSKSRIWKSKGTKEQVGIKGSVQGGIEIVRMKLWPVMGDPELYFLRGDDGVESIFANLRQYHWKLDAVGNVTNEPDKDDDDGADALRYMIMNTFPPKGKTHIPTPKEGEITTTLSAKVKHEEAQQYTVDNWAQKKIAELTSGVAPEPTATINPKRKGKTGGFVWDI